MNEKQFFPAVLVLVAIAPILILGYRFVTQWNVYEGFESDGVLLSVAFNVVIALVLTYSYFGDKETGDN